MQNRHTADKQSVIVYVSKGGRVQYKCSVHHCLSQFFEGKNELGTFFSSCFEHLFHKNLKPGSYVRGDVNSNKKQEPPYCKNIETARGGMIVAIWKGSQALHEVCGKSSHRITSPFVLRYYSSLV